MTQHAQLAATRNYVPQPGARRQRSSAKGSMRKVTTILTTNASLARKLRV